MDRGAATYHEIMTQPEAWADALQQAAQARPALQTLLDAPVEQVVFTGCGSTYYLSIAAAALFQELSGRPARAVPGSELLFNPGVALTGGKTLLVAVSRSGATTETVRAVEQFRRQGRGPVVVITNYGAAPLAGLADVALVIERGQEQSMAQTRSFASMYVAATALAAQAAGRDDLLAACAGLPEAGARLIERCAVPARQVGEDLSLDRWYFLGSGLRYGLACEVNLKMKEMALTHSEPFHFLEFRHGPMSMVTEGTLIAGLLSQGSAAHERRVLDEMQARGGRVLALGEAGTDVAFESGLPESVRGVLYLPALQLAGYHRAMAKGLDPDRPNNLSAVIKLDL